jgi:hypothetical protein
VSAELIDSGGEFVSWKTIPAALGISERTFYRRVRECGITVFADGRDLRRRLVRRSDIDALLAPRPAPRLSTAERQQPGGRA